MRSLAVIGPNANVARVGGGGSAAVRPIYAVSPLDGIRPRVDRPVKELKAFRRVVLKSGETQAVSFTLDKSAMAFL